MARMFTKSWHRLFIARAQKRLRRKKDSLVKPQFSVLATAWGHRNLERNLKPSAQKFRKTKQGTLSLYTDQHILSLLACGEKHKWHWRR